MSMSPLLIAVNNHLQSELHLEDSQIGIQPWDQPSPDAGQLYITITGDSWTNPQPEPQGTLAEEMGFSVTVNLRVPDTPVDRFGRFDYIGFTGQTEHWTRLVRASIHLSIPLFYAMNDLVINSGNKFITRPVWRHSEPLPQLRMPEWFFAESDEPVIAGLSQKSFFDFGQRYQTYDNMRNEVNL